jgi:hypothetical protein
MVELMWKIEEKWMVRTDYGKREEKIRPKWKRVPASGACMPGRTAPRVKVPHMRKAVNGTTLVPVRLAAPWWDRYPERAAREIQLMEENTNAAYSFQDRQLVWSETIYNNYGRPFTIAIAHQHNHPFDLPKAFVLEPQVPPDLKHHIWPHDESLCLYMPGDLDSSTTALTIRNLACMWATAYEVYLETGEWITREH